MTVETLEKDLKAGNQKALYLLYGEEQYLIETNLKRIKTLFGECIQGINYISIDDQNVSEIISDIETPSFGYPKKLIIAKNTGLFKKDAKKATTDIAKIKEKLTSYIKENIKIIDESVVIVFIEDDVDARSALYKEIEKDGIVCKFDFQKPFQLEQRIKSICNAYKVNIDNQTAQYFIECCGTSMQELINEIRKLIEYAGENGTIKKEDIDSLSVKKLESVIFDLTDDLGKKDIAKALQVLKKFDLSKRTINKNFCNII